ncbi:hypothetical protein BC332_01930 [Capsicum chinense]|nr:hypothetical protein BC332_01930 [Capsicum chinense]
MEVKDVVSCNALVIGYSQIGRFDEALELFERMREEEIELNVVTWSVVILGYCEQLINLAFLLFQLYSLVDGKYPGFLKIIEGLSHRSNVELSKHDWKGDNEMLGPKIIWIMYCSSGF